MLKDIGLLDELDVFGFLQELSADEISRSVQMRFGPHDTDAENTDIYVLFPTQLERDIMCTLVEVAVSSTILNGHAGEQGFRIDGTPGVDYATSQLASSLFDAGAKTPRRITQEEPLDDHFGWDDMLPIECF